MPDTVTIYEGLPEARVPGPVAHFGLGTTRAEAEAAIDGGALDAATGVALQTGFMDHTPRNLHKLTGLRSIHFFEESDALELEPIFQVAQLEALEVSGRKTPFPPGIGALTALKALTIHSCTTLPDDLGGCTALETLEIDACKKLVEVPESLGQLAALTRLLLKDSGVTELPDLGGLQSLETLEVSGGRLKRLPQGLPSLRRLRRVDVREVPCRSMPDGLSALEALGHLHVEGLTKLPADVDALVERAQHGLHLRLFLGHKAYDKLDPGLREKFGKSVQVG